MEFRNLKISKLSLLIKPIEQWRLLNIQLISIKNPIFNVPLNIFLFNNWKKWNACRFLNSYALTWYEACRLKNYLWGQILYRSLDPAKKRRHFSFLFLLFGPFLAFLCLFLCLGGACTQPRSQTYPVWHVTYRQLYFPVAVSD